MNARRLLFLKVALVFWTGVAIGIWVPPGVDLLVGLLIDDHPPKADQRFKPTLPEGHRMLMSIRGDFDVELTRSEIDGAMMIGFADPTLIPPVDFYLELNPSELENGVTVSFDGTFTVITTKKIDSDTEAIGDE